jgi:predicted O-methyltransferase YrrM
MGDEAQVLYLCVRLDKPALVVETGVGAGVSTTFILQALKVNNHGKLYSIDFYKDDEQCGWLVPTDLKNRWKLIRGLSKQALNPLLVQLGLIDLFIHDSDHSYENMMAEFRTVWPFLKSGGIFLVHDVGRNDAFFDFCKEVNFSWWRARTYPVLAGIRKT